MPLRFLARSALLALLAVPVALVAQDASPFSFGATYEEAAARGQLVGSAVVVLRDGEPVVSEAFGVSDLAAKSPMSPDTTAFRATSVTKSLTAMAVLKLVDEGRLDLDADIARYLDFPLRDAAKYPQPIRLRDLLTHTAGFEERSRDFYMPASTALADYVATHQPARIWPPGRTVSYSNYGYALAGRIVEIASGQPFEDYVAASLFAPLGLGTATLEKPHPGATLARLAPEYAGAKPEPLRYLPDTPAGGLVATPREIASIFTAALLPSPDGPALLPASATQALASRQFSLHPAVDGVTFGMRELRYRGRRVLYAGGDSCCHHTDVYVVPEERLVYVHAYSGADRRFRGEMWRAFAGAHLAPATPQAPESTAAAAGVEASDAAGHYRLTRRAERSMLALPYRFTSAIEVVAAPDGTLTIPGVFRRPDGEPRRYAPLGGGVFEEPDDRHRIAFLRADDGRVERLAGGGLVEAHRAATWTSPRVLGPALGASFAIAVVTLLAALVALVRRRRTSSDEPRAVRLHRRAMRFAALGAIGFALVFGGFAAKAQTDLALLSADYDIVWRVAQAFAALLVVAVVVGLATFGPAFARARIPQRAWLAAQLLAFAVLAWAVLAHHILQPAVYY